MITNTDRGNHERFHGERPDPGCDHCFRVLTIFQSPVQDAELLMLKVRAVELRAEIDARRSYELNIVQQIEARVAEKKLIAVLKRLGGTP